MLVIKKKNYKEMKSIDFGFLYFFFPCMKSRVEYDLTTRNHELNFGCIIDRFLSKQIIVRKKLQSVGLVAMLLAWKYEEVLVPVVGNLILISDKAYTWKEVLEMVLFFGYDYAHYIRFISYNKQLTSC